MLAAAQAGDGAAFEQLVAGHRRGLHTHCYRMLGSLHDAEDAMQETLVAAWRGLAGLQRPEALRAWLYRIATNCCLRLASKRPRRVLSWDYGPSRQPDNDLGAPVTGGIFLDPWPDEVGTGSDPDMPESKYSRKESVELAYVAALQYLPPNQRAVLLLRDVLSFPAAEVAGMLDTSTASVNSALQRARQTVTERVPERSQFEERLAADQQPVVDAFVAAWERADVPALVELLAQDVRFTMPPLPAWFDGRADVARFLTEHVFATPWRLVPIGANGQPALACYRGVEGRFLLGAVNVLSFRAGRISWIASFLEPQMLTRFGLPDAL
jgi:RNA polymerase sigma-70 factor (TIGR02960 family)